MRLEARPPEEDGPSEGAFPGRDYESAQVDPRFARVGTQEVWS
jgi:hypothetical protein